MLAWCVLCLVATDTVSTEAVYTASNAARRDAMQRCAAQHSTIQAQHKHRGQTLVDVAKPGVAQAQFGIP